MRKITLIVFVNISVLYIAFFIVEVFINVNDPIRKLPFNDITKKDQLYTWGHVVINNRHGFRENDFASPKPKDVFRIMVLGDSLTWEAGLAPSERYTNLIERKLSKSLPAKNIEVLNFAYLTGSTQLERITLQKYIDEVDPDLIILGFCINDPQINSQDYSHEKENFTIATATHLTFIKESFKKLDLVSTGIKIEYLFFKIAESFNMFPSWQEALQRCYDRDSTCWKNFIRSLKEIREISDSRELPNPIFAILNQGVYRNKPTNYRNPDKELKIFLNWYHQAEDLAKKLGFYTCNFEEEIALSLSKEILAINVLDGHPSAALNEIYADKLSEIIASNHLNNNISINRLSK